METTQRVTGENVNIDLVDKLNSLKEDYQFFISRKKSLTDHESIFKEYILI